MKRNRQLILGAIIVFLGIVLLFDAIFDINIWGLLCPSTFILLGIWMLVRPRLSETGAATHFFFARNIRRHGAWQVTNEEYWAFAVDANLDLSFAELPVGESTLQFFAFANEVKLTIPEDVGVSVNSFAIITEDHILGNKQDHIFYPLSWESPNFTTADRKLIITANSFVFDIRIKHSQPLSKSGIEE